MNLGKSASPQNLVGQYPSSPAHFFLLFFRERRKHVNNTQLTLRMVFSRFCRMYGAHVLCIMGYRVLIVSSTLSLNFAFSTGKRNESYNTNVKRGYNPSGYWNDIRTLSEYVFTL